MSLPPNIQAMIRRGLDEVYNNPEHQLPVSHRHELYRAFSPTIDLNGSIYQNFLATGQLTLPNGFERYGQLAILAARQVLPVWEDGMAQISDAHLQLLRNLPYQFIELATGVLYRTIDVSQAHDTIYHELYHDLGGTAAYISQKVYTAAVTSYHAAGMIFGVSPINNPDAATTAVAAYASYDDSEPFIQRLTGTERPALRFDRHKCLKFWEWWLTEAIPAAWEMAERSPSRT